MGLDMFGLEIIMSRITLKWVGISTLIGLVLSFFIASMIFYIVTANIFVLYTGCLCLVIALFWGFVFWVLVQKSVENFTNDICYSMDRMINHTISTDNMPYNEQLFSKVHFRLLRISEILQEDRLLLHKEKKVLHGFISDTSHQIKTPMANLKMISDTLLSLELTQEDRLSFLKSSATQLTKLQFIIDALVKSSRLETGLITLNKQCHNLQDILAQVTTLALPLLSKKNQDVVVDCYETFSIFTDRKWMIEAIFNVVENAIKYSPPNSKIAITISKMEMYTMIAIKDTGCGIKEEAQGSIFNRFYRGANAIDLEGIGIGLYLAREIITLHQGYISVKSDGDKGSTFFIHLLN